MQGALHQQYLGGVRSPPNFRRYEIFASCELPYTSPFRVRPLPSKVPPKSIADATESLKMGPCIALGQGEEGIPVRLIRSPPNKNRCHERSPSSFYTFPVYRCSVGPRVDNGKYGCLSRQRCRGFRRGSVCLAPYLVYRTE